MPINEVTGLPVVDETEATPEILRIYDEIRRDMRIPFVPNMYKAVAGSPESLRFYWSAFQLFYQQITMPEAIVTMIFYAVARANNCQYCSAGHEASCRLMGIDEDILQGIAHDLGRVSPERLRTIMEFAVQMTYDPKSVTTEDYDRLREHGISDSEIIEIVMITALGRMGDALADALKIEVDEQAKETLGQ